VKVRLLKNTCFDNFCYAAGKVMEVEPSRYIEDLVKNGFVAITKDRVTDKSPTPKPRGLGLRRDGD